MTRKAQKKNFEIFFFIDKILNKMVKKIGVK